MDTATPVKLIVGVNDPAMSAEVMEQTWRVFFPEAELTILPDAGHYPMFEAPVSLATSIEKKAGEWNEVEIQCIGRHLTVYLNGNRIHKIDIDDSAFVFAEKRPLSRVPNQGYIGLESHTNRVDFRDLRIQVLKPAA